MSGLLKIRLQTWSGLFEVIFTLAYGLIMQDELYQALVEVWYPVDCKDFGTQIATIMKYLIGHNAPNEVFYKQMV